MYRKDNHDAKREVQEGSLVLRQQQTPILYQYFLSSFYKIPRYHYGIIQLLD